MYGKDAYKDIYAYPHTNDLLNVEDVVHVATELRDCVVPLRWTLASAQDLNIRSTSVCTVIVLTLGTFVLWVSRRLLDATQVACDRLVVRLRSRLELACASVLLRIALVPSLDV